MDSTGRVDGPFLTERQARCSIADIWTVSPSLPPDLIHRQKAPVSYIQIITADPHNLLPTVRPGKRRSRLTSRPWSNLSPWPPDPFSVTIWNTALQRTVYYIWLWYGGSTVNHYSNWAYLDGKLFYCVLLFWEISRASNKPWLIFAGDIAEWQDALAVIKLIRLLPQCWRSIGYEKQQL